MFITALADHKLYKTHKHCIMLLKQKRTVAEEKRVFTSKWEIDTNHIIETKEFTTMCLICRLQVVKTVKRDNAKWHFCRHTSEMLVPN